MKTLLASVFVVSALSVVVPAQAGQQTVSIGYAQSKVQDFKDISGVNVKYRYEWDSPLSFIGSLTYMSGSNNYHDSVDTSSMSDTVSVYNSLDIKSDLKYYSLSIGPAYRINDYFSVYGLLGANLNKGSDDAVWKTDGKTFQQKRSTFKNTSFMYGVGMQINPVKYLVVDIGYEGSSVDAEERSLSVNGFNLGVGYSF
ncbi:Ail/Lom family outer membrane beta-barrel protein [Erwinia sp.]|uniref:Ail/Lom family outer membrane beta-barrel protein n=1 Tax=Erwinia citreus TaxID=558 RepID=UPI003C7132C8